MGIEAIIGGGLGLLGSMGQADAQRRSADAQVEAARIAAEAAKFKPYAVTTGFGRGFFDEAAQTAGYELDPRLAAARDFYYQQAELGRQRAAELDPQAYAAEVLAEQQGLLAPQRRAEDIALRQQQLQRGRIGLGVSPEALGAGMMGGAVNPEQYAQQLARAQTDAQMAVASRQAGIAERERRLAEAQGLFAAGTGVETLGMKPLDMGSAYGGQASQAGAAAGELLQRGMTGAAQTRLAGESILPGELYDFGQSLMGQKYNKPVAMDAIGGLFNTPVRSLPYLSDPMTAYRGITNFNYGLG
jgi:hypothetical protein